ncbi:hypothetical protein HPP92_010190 [Vanilla planifolia]|uniref:SMAX1-like nucleotide binding domain-containing protein n=1 Tax=Vanilla planifolia TaxID=51239 RepID=A0A835QYG0_VANPL|nr:hypothetical protein HPP92_010190 [Vanilla planifolia]
MKCKAMNPSLESQWALQPVVIPSGGLALSLRGPSGMLSVVPMVKDYHFPTQETRLTTFKEEQEKLVCCAECMANCNNQAASVFKSGAKETVVDTSKPWLQIQKPENIDKETFLELRRKWSRLCQSLHQPRIGQAQTFVNQTHSTTPWWSKSFPSAAKSKLSMEPSSISFTSHGGESTQLLLSESSPDSQKKPIATTLALSSSMFTNSETSTNHQIGNPVSQCEDLKQKLQDNIPWHREKIPMIVDALLDCRSSEKKGRWMMVHGNDRIAKRRLARVLAMSFFGSAQRVAFINARRLGNKATGLLKGALEMDSRIVVLIEDIDRGDPEFIKLIKDGIIFGFLKDPCGKEVDLRYPIFVITTCDSAKSTVKVEERCELALKMSVLKEEEEDNVPPTLVVEKRKREWKHEKVPKRSKAADKEELDLNLPFPMVEDDEEDGFQSDLTQESCAGMEDVQLPAITLPNLDAETGMAQLIAEGFIARLRKALEEVVGSSRLDIVVAASKEDLASAFGFFLESEFDRWMREIFQICIPTVKNGGKVRLQIEVEEETLAEWGFLGSALPRKITLASGAALSPPSL